ncbi:hypothetical protein EPN29_05845 [bacterium]|nr:MAG: hypothetical protein EPN29_05845 [bacterium]
MLGEVLGEGGGKMIGTKLLPPEGPEFKIEASTQGAGKLLGEDVTELTTYWQTMRPEGSLYGEGRVLFMTSKGESLLWKGFGVGRPTGPPPAARFAVCGAFQTVPARFERLLGAATVTEYVIEADGSYHYKTQEWVAQPATVMR